MMLLSTLLITWATFTAAQDYDPKQCTCKSDPKNGYWASSGGFSGGVKAPVCDVCQVGYGGFDCTIDLIRGTEHVCTAEVNCNSNGLCDPNTGRCICDKGFNGEYCQTCAPGHVGFSCLPNDCIDDVDAAVNCSGHGKCPSEALVDQSCGTRVCGGPDSGCCQWQTSGHWGFDETEFPEWKFPGVEQRYSCRNTALGETCCGGNKCSFNEECVDENQGKCCTKEEQVCFKTFANGTNDATRPTDIQCCAKGTHCCDGTCCADGQTCNLKPFGRNEGKNRLGVLAKQQSICVAHGQAATKVSLFAVARAFFYPIGFALSTMFCLLMLCKHSPLGGVPKACAILLIFPAILLTVSGPLWAEGVLVSVVTILSLFAASSDSRKIRIGGLAASVFMLFCILSNVMDLFGHWGAVANVPPWSSMTYRGNLGVNFLGGMLSSARSCSDHYQYFRNDARLRKWDASAVRPLNNADGFDLYFGFCSYFWLTVGKFIGAILPAVMSVFSVSLFLEVLDAAPEASTSNYSVEKDVEMARYVPAKGAPAIPSKENQYISAKGAPAIPDKPPIC